MAEATKPSFLYKNASGMAQITPVVDGFDLPDNKKIFFGNDDDVAQYWDGTNLVFNPVVGETMAFGFASGVTTIYGGDSAGDDLKLRSNTTDVYSALELDGNSNVNVRIAAGQNIRFDENATFFMVFNRSGSTYTTDATGGNAWFFDSDTVDTGNGLKLDVRGLTSGIGLKINADSDILTTGQLILVEGGSARDKSWFEIIKNSSDTEGCQVIIDGDNAAGAAAKPSLRIGSAEDGFFVSAANTLGVVTSGTDRFRFTNSQMYINLTNGAALDHSIPSATNPGFNFLADTDTGLGRAAADALSLISGGAEGQRIVETNSVIYNLLDFTQQDSVTDATTDGSTTITKTGENFVTTCAVGDTVLIWGGTTTADYGMYTITSVTDDENLVLSSAPSGSNADVDFYVLRNAITATGGFLYGHGGFKIDPHIGTAGVTTIYGGATSGGDLKLAANANNAYSFILIEGNSHINLETNTPHNIVLKEAGTAYMTFNRSASTYTTDASSQTAWEFDTSTVDSGICVRIEADGLVGGTGLQIFGDSDVLTTGRLLYVIGGAAKDKSWLEVIKNSSDTEGCQVIIDGDNVTGAAAKPSLRIGSVESGWYCSSTTSLKASVGGVERMTIGSDSMSLNATGAASMRRNSPSISQPAYAFVGDENTGMYQIAAGAIGISTDGVEATRWTEASSAVIQAHQANVGLTADVSSVQGGEPLTASYNVISTCANAGDAVTLPATFIVGTIIKIKNDGANSCDVFPASGDDLGAGADAAAALAAGASITYIATAADSVWTSIGN